jgi:hypothetical protein
MILKVNYSDLKFHISELAWFIAQELGECNAGYIAALYIYIYIYIYIGGSGFFIVALDIDYYWLL